ncbi:16801_t:CDS:2 [Funneliformis mosseae]|uniref:16801_t:CDS:1 n=1 Tax=Funneliformis mosseae TaxID=27381 RepID=A0A9N9DQ53_FUNMO|nr:16801_t:CDS:2 [Funneliformis mosseae]
MPSKKYYTDLEKGKIYAVKELKESIMILECDESDSDYASYKARDWTYQPKKEDSQSKVYVKKKFASKKLHDEQIASHLFLKLTRLEFKEYGITLRQALKFEDYIKDLCE